MWRSEARDLRADGYGWADIARVLQPKYFPDSSQEKVAERVRSYMRRNRDNILEEHGLDPLKWRVTHFKTRNKFSQVSVRPIDEISLDDIDKKFENLCREPEYEVYRTKTSRPMLAEVNIADLHLGKMCWHGISEGNYDHKIAREMFYGIVDDICEELSERNIEKILFVWSNDYFNADTIDNKTTAGTPQDVDSRFEKLFDVGVSLLVHAIKQFVKIAPVETFYTPSNHDKMASFYAIRLVEAYFRNHANVTVHKSVKRRFYYSYGNSLIGFCHGDQEGRASRTKQRASRLASLMPIEAREQWGKAVYREMHTAHLHSEQMIQEINGVIVRRVSTPTENDSWHVESAFVGQVRKAQTFLWDKEHGLKCIINTPIT